MKKIFKALLTELSRFILLANRIKVFLIPTELQKKSKLENKIDENLVEETFQNFKEHFNQTKKDWKYDNDLDTDALTGFKESVEKLLNDNYKIGENVSAIVIDVHGEATSEKMAIGHAFDGRVSFIVGTHTHVPTADSQILEKGTAYQSDAGMCGDYDSVIGGEKNGWVSRFKHKMPTGRINVSDGLSTLCGVIVNINDATGLAINIEPIIIGPHLINRIPEKI